MSQGAVRAGLDAYTSAFTGAGDVATEGVVYLPKPGVGYLACRLSGYTRTPIALGANAAFQESGLYQVSVNRPTVEGMKSAGRFADLIVALFPRATVIALATGQVLTIESASAQPAVPSGDWISIPVVVRWFAIDNGP